MGFVEYGPEVVECLLMAAIAERGGTASQMRGRKQRAAIHRPQRSLGAGDSRSGSFPRSRGHEPGVQLTREPVLRLIGVAGQPRRLRPGRRGG